MSTATSAATSAEITDLIAAATAVTETVRTEFGGMTVDQLNWQPSPSSWSIGQCLDHLLITNAGFFPAFEAIQAGRYRHSLWQRLPILPGLIGSLFVSAVSPTATRKVKAPKRFQPAAVSSVSADIVLRFTQQQATTVAHLDAMRAVDARRIILSSPASGLITYSLRDACHILVLHEQRHLQQAQRVARTPEFPTSV